MAATFPYRAPRSYERLRQALAVRGALAGAGVLKGVEREETAFASTADRS